MTCSCNNIHYEIWSPDNGNSGDLHIVKECDDCGCGLSVSFLDRLEEYSQKNLRIYMEGYDLY